MTDQQDIKDFNCRLCGQPVTGLPGKGFAYVVSADTGETYVRHLNGQCPRLVEFTKNPTGLL